MNGVPGTDMRHLETKEKENYLGDNKYLFIAHNGHANTAVLLAGDTYSCFYTGQRKLPLHLVPHRCHPRLISYKRTIKNGFHLIHRDNIKNPQWNWWRGSYLTFFKLDTNQIFITTYVYWKILFNFIFMAFNLRTR